MNGKSSLLIEAIEYARRGWSIIPVVGKEPPKRMKWKEFQNTAPNERVLRQLFSLPEITGLAVLL